MMIIIQAMVLLLQGKGTVVKSYMYKNSAKVPKYLDYELLMDPLYSRGNRVHYDFLHLHFRRCKMTHVGLLSVGVLPYNNHVIISNPRVRISNYSLFVHVNTILVSTVND